MNDEIEIILQPSEVEVTTPLVADYVLPKATATVLGGVKIGDNVNVGSDGTISIPTASATTGGVIKVGDNLSIDVNGVLSASTDYTLPQATKTTLGGVYVDDALDNSSLNPVQNSVISTAISNVANDLDNLSDTVGDIDDDLTALENTVGSLSGDLDDLEETVDTNTGNIAINTGNITSLSNTVGDLNTDVTNLGDALNDVASQVSGLTVDISSTYNYSDIDPLTWTSGEVTISGKGYYAVMYINLDGSLSVASNSSVTLMTLDNDDLPILDAYGICDATDGTLSIKVDYTTGNVILYNNNSTTVNASKLRAGIPLIYGSI